MAHQLPQAFREPLLRRVCREFSEMPGLGLTRAQVGRLLELDEDSCRRLLAVLVDAGFLRLIGSDSYARSTESGFVGPDVQAARARLGRYAPRLNKRAG